MAKFNNVEMTVSRFNKSRNIQGTYNKESAIDILAAIPFNIINIPLYSYRNILEDNDSRTGYVVVGSVMGYNPDTDEFNLLVHEKYASIIEGYDNPIIYPRVLVDRDGNVVKVIGLDICPKMYYQLLK